MLKAMLEESKAISIDIHYSRLNTKLETYIATGLTPSLKRIAVGLKM